MNEGNSGSNKRPPSFFIAGIIQGSSRSRDLSDQGYRGHLAEILKKIFPDADIISPYDLHPNSIDYDLDKGKATFLEMVSRAKHSDVLIAYLPEASLGTAIEMWESFRSGVTIWTISPMKENWVVRFFSHRVFASLGEFERYLLERSQEEVQRAIRCRRQRSETVSDPPEPELRS
jgi:hypothetical protein